MTNWRSAGAAVPPTGPRWRDLSIIGRVYVATVIVIGAAALVLFFPRTYPPPALFIVLVATACLTSSWKVNLPIPVANGSTLSVSYAANLMALLLLGPAQAVVVALAGVWTQCTYKPKQPYPLHRTLFSSASVVITMLVTGATYVSLGGTIPPSEIAGLAKPLVGAIAVYFLFNTGLIAGAIAVSTHRGVLETWRSEFLWLGASFMAAGTAGAVAAIVVDRGDHWKAVLLAAPIYLTYRTYDLIVGRLEDQKRHMAQMHELHEQTVTALRQARDAERALATEKERLTATLEQMKRLEAVRKQLLEREHTARASAEQANHLKDQFLATVSHELRTPLTAIFGWADMLRRGGLLPTQHDRAVSAIYGSAKRQAELIDDLLDVARIMSGKLRLDQKLVNVKSVVRDALHVIQPAADANEIKIVLESDTAIEPIFADAARLQQIAWNLLSNAVKFSRPGGVVHVSLRRGADAVELVVSDSGQGISPEFLPAVFDPFRQADGSTTRVHRGLGIGLSIVKSLVEAHGGTVSAQSDGEGLGASFTVRLPAAPEGTPPEPAGSRTLSRLEPVQAGLSLDGISVLVVDDDLDAREVVAACLEESHAGVITAESAAQALDVLQRERVDVLLADIGMPGEDGYSLIRKIRALPARETALIPAAALTALARDEDRTRALEAGFELHLAKPIDAQSLVTAVAALGKVPRSTETHRLEIS